MARRGTGGGRHRTLLIVAVAAGVLALAASALWADIAVPKRKGPAPQPGLGLFVGGAGNMDVDVEVTEKGSKVYLIMPAPNLGNPVGKPAPGAEAGARTGGVTHDGVQYLVCSRRCGDSD